MPELLAQLSQFTGALSRVNNSGVAPSTVNITLGGQDDQHSHGRSWRARPYQTARTRETWRRVTVATTLTYRLDHDHAA